MADLRGFDANNVEPAKGLDPLPAGKYLSVITASEIKANKANTGSYLELTFAVVEGAHKGRTIKSRLNLNNPNETAVKIAQAELSAICRAVGVLAPADSAELHDLPLVISVACRKRDDNGEIANEVRAYAKREAHTPPPAQAAAAPPWKRS